MIVDYIGAHRDRFEVAPICTLLAKHGATRVPSTYYATADDRVSAVDLDYAYRVNLLLDLHRGGSGSTGGASSDPQPATADCASAATRSNG